MQKTFLYFSYVMIVVFILCGLAIIIAPPQALQNPKWVRFVGGACLMLYAIFRWQRLTYLRRKHRNDEEQ
jgi:hypothetical protein